MSDHFPVEYLSWRHMKTSGDYQVTIGFPAEAFSHFMSTIGPPPESGKSQWLAVAKLDKPDGSP
jgi:hypothetical protein